jgi:FkbM family methyltransferase
MRIFNPGTVDKIISRLIGLIPARMRGLFYRVPFMHAFLQKALIRLLDPGPAKVRAITAGPLKNFKLEINIYNEKFYWLATYERGVQSCLQQVVTRGAVAYDIGAHIGYFSLLLSLLCGPDGKILAFEPEPLNYRRILKHIDLNGLKNVEVFPIAVSDKNGTGALWNLGDSAQGHLLHSSPNSSSKGEDNTSLRNVEIVSLDEFVFNQGHPPPGIIKIDTEGEEARIIDGMERLLSAVRPIIVCEIHRPELGTDIWRKLDKKDYHFIDIEKNMSLILTQDNWDTHHLLAYPKELEPDLLFRS